MTIPDLPLVALEPVSKDLKLQSSRSLSLVFPWEYPFSPFPIFKSPLFEVLDMLPAALSRRVHQMMSRKFVCVCYWSGTTRVLDWGGPPKLSNGRGCVHRRRGSNAIVEKIENFPQLRRSKICTLEQKINKKKKKKNYIDDNDDDIT